VPRFFVLFRSFAESHSNSEFRFPNFEFRFPIFAFQFPISEFRIPISDFRFPPSAFRIPPSAFQITMTKSYLIDMDGVIVRGSELIPGADEFIRRLHQHNIQFLILTNNPMYTPRDLHHRLQRIGIDVMPEHLFTSALATATFLKAQAPNSTVFALGESGLTEALHDAGFVLTDHDPDYVVLGETKAYSYGNITHAVRLIKNGARFVATNPDVAGPGEGGVVPACGAVAALIQAATGVAPYFVGKPNPLMMRSALRFLNEHSENAIMIGDNMLTDVRMGIESGLETVLVLTGVTTREMVAQYPYRPTRIVESVAELEL
jgi:NagD protein